MLLAIALLAASSLVVFAPAAKPPPPEKHIAVVIYSGTGLLNARVTSAQLYLFDGSKELPQENMTVGRYPNGTSTGVLHSVRLYPRDGSFELIMTVDGAPAFYSFDLSRSVPSADYWMVQV